MRIEWREDSARAVSGSLEQVIEEMELSKREARQVRAALREADPDGTNRRLRAIEARFEAAMSRLKRATEEAAELKARTDQMVTAFENGESEAIRTLNNLDPGRGTLERREGTAMPAAAIQPEGWVEPRVVPPIELPRARIAPIMRLSALGLIPAWLRELAEGI